MPEIVAVSRWNLNVMLLFWTMVNLLKNLERVEKHAMCVAVHDICMLLGRNWEDFFHIKQ